MNRIKRISLGLIAILIVSIIHLGNVSAATGGWTLAKDGWKYSDGYNYYTGWHQIDGNWYYFNEDKTMVQNTWVNGYYLDSKGVWVSSTTNNSAICFADKNLELAIRNEINKPTGDLYKSDVDVITRLIIRNADIKTLNGLENLTNLKGFMIVDSANSLSDISALKSMSSLDGVTLRSMNLTSSQIINTLRGLKLKNISLYGNNFSYQDKCDLAKAVPTAETYYLSVY